jgi:hypothetical protein
MKPLSILLILPAVILLAACGKENLSSGRELLGSWVDINHTADTLVFYKKDGMVVLLDNSLTYRTIRHNSTSFDLLTNLYEVRLGDGTLLTRPLNMRETGLENFSRGKFDWLDGKYSFKVEPNGFRPYLSCMGCPQVFRKID